MSSDGSKTWVEIDANAYEKNIQAIRSLLQPGVTFCVVIKANAYGHGITEIVRLALRQGISHFAVDSIDEAKQVREASHDSTVFILGFTPWPRLIEVISLDCVQTVYDEETVKKIGEIAVQQQRKAFVSVKCETGTQRQGIDERGFKHLLASIVKQRPHLQLIGLASHFSSSEDTTKPHVTQAQFNRFLTYQSECNQFGLQPMFEHISCSASTILYPNTHASMVRVGIAQYGLWASEALKSQKTSKQPSFKLYPVLSWKTRIAQVKDVPSGTPIGYDQVYVTDRPMRIGVLTVGYADGFARTLSQKAHVLIRGQKCRILGNICMNMSIVDISTLPQVRAGEPVTLLGRDGMHEITAEDHARWSDTINYEVVTRINPLLPRYTR